MRGESIRGRDGRFGSLADLNANITPTAVSGGKADVNEGLIQADARECPLFPKAAAQIRDF